MFCRGVVSLLVWCTLLAPCAAQTQTQTPAPPPAQPDLSQVPLSLDRIREGVQREQKLNIPFLNPDTPVFHVHVEENGLKLGDYWKVGPDTAVSRDVRSPYASNWHHEFLSMVTPTQRMGVGTSPFGIFGNPVYPVGVPVLPISSAIKSAWRNYQLDRIRKQIADELKEIEENRRRQPEKPTVPPPPQ
jgi:hypothetical protein